MELKKQNRTESDRGTSSHQRMLDRILRIAERFSDEQTQTIIPFLIVHRRDRPTPFTPAVLAPSFCLIVQGTKRVHIGPDTFVYRAGEFLASVIDMPAAGNIVDATKKAPYIGLQIDFTTKEIASVITEAKIAVELKDRRLSPAAFVGRADSELLGLSMKLLKLLDKPTEVTFLSSLIKQEMIFRLLTGSYGHLFFQQLLFELKSKGIGKVIDWIRQNYSSPFTIKQLAKSNGMSVSGLHHKFKSITTLGPLQYQKQLRLQEARRLMLSGLMDATTAGRKVGYESPSQFSREYRRLFGLPPLKDIKATRKNPGAGVLGSN